VARATTTFLVQEVILDLHGSIQASDGDSRDPEPRTHSPILASECDHAGRRERVFSI
jgi:hypothetical protein